MTDLPLLGTTALNAAGAAGLGQTAGMSTSGAQAAAFFRDVVETNLVWWVRDDDGSPAPPASTGQRAFPYWSSEARARRAATLWGPQFQVLSMPLSHWQSAELPELDRDGFRVGINWSGPRLTGWDFLVSEVETRLAHALGETTADDG